jgi:hypothetical protein
MLKKLAYAVAALTLAGGAFAQEAEDEATRREPATTHKVLQHPYDIASFYRSSQGQGYFGYAGEDALASKYPIASFYRNRQGGGYPGGYGYQGGYGFSNFWTGGYSAARPGVSIGYRHRIGQNGDLFLFAPVFLAPVGPLAGGFGY